MVVIAVVMEQDRRLGERAARQRGLVKWADVRAVGLSSRQWTRRANACTWVEVAPGVWRHAAVAMTWDVRLQAGLLWLGPSAALFGPTAAAWWGLEGFGPGPVEFVVPRLRRSLDPAMTLHTTTRWNPGDVLRLEGLRLTSVTRTVIDLAGTSCTAGRLETAIDSGIHQRRTSIPTLTRRMADLGGSGRSGICRLRELLLDAGGESYLERRFLRLVRGAGFPRPACQVVHRGSTGRVARVDFEFPGTSIIVEVTGRLGHVSDRERQRDARRRNQLQAGGWIVLEFTTADVLDDPQYVLASLRTHLSRSCHAPTTAAVVAV